MEDQAVHVVRQIDERDFGLGALDADGADQHAHVGFLLGENMLDPRADLRLCSIPAPYMIRHRLASGLAAMDPADPTPGFKPLFVGLAAIRRVGPDI